MYDKSNDYGLGRVSGYVAHWDHPNNDGWSTYRYWGGVNSNGFAYGDITVPPGTQRLVVVLTWDEPAASAGASRAVTYDVDLWLDHLTTATSRPGGAESIARFPRSTTSSTSSSTTRPPAATG